MPDVKVFWNSIAGVTSYDVQYKKSADSAWSDVGSTSSTNMIVTGLLNCTNYDFQIIGSCALGTPVNGSIITINVNAGGCC